jgi:hypothetical protein
VPDPRSLARLLPKPLLRGIARLAWPGGHPSLETLERFLRGRSSSWETLAIVLHLIPGCPQCRRITAAYWEIGTPPDDLPEEVAHRFRYDGLVDRVLSNLRRSHADLLPEQAQDTGLRALTLQSPPTISTNPIPSTQPNLSPRKVAASTDVTSGCSVPYAATSAGEERRTAQVFTA